MINPQLIKLAEKLGNEVPPKEETPKPKPDPIVQPKVSNTKEYIILENIVCTDANGKPFEQYPELFIKKDIEREDKGKQINHTPYEWIPYLEDKDLFLPSFALSCNILAALYNKRNDPEINKILMQYQDYGPGWGWHAQNTIVDWGANKIIHYPNKNSNGNNINTARQTRELPFKKKNIKDMPLKEALKNKDFKAYVQNLTGLTQPETLTQIGKHFNKQTYIWASSSNDKRAAWLGCNIDFNLNASSNLGDIAARGVRAEKIK